MTSFRVHPGGLMGLDDEQCRKVFEAGRASLSPHIACRVVEFEPGWFAIYGPGTTFPMLVTNDWNDLLAAYRARPPYVPHRGAPSVTSTKAPSGINLSKLDISL